MYQKLMLHNLLLPLDQSVPLVLFKASEDAQQLGLSDYNNIITLYCRHTVQFYKKI